MSVMEQAVPDRPPSPAGTTLPALQRVGGRPRLGAYLREVWQRRAFVLALARFRIEAENGRNRLGMAWVVLRPLLNAGVYGLVFGFFLQTSRDVDDFIAFLVIGVFMFEFFSTCLTTGARSITGNSALVQSLSFPRMALPLALVVQRFLQFLPMLAMMAAVAVGYGHLPRVEWLLLVPLTLLFTLFNTGLTLVVARLTVHVRDLTHVLPFVSRLFFYSSGVFFSIETRLADRPWALAAADLQPVHEFLTLARGILLSGPDHPLPAEYWGYAAAWSVGLLVVGVLFFWSAEERYGRD